MKMKRERVCKGILGLVGATSIACFLGGATSFAAETLASDSATSTVDILIKEDPNVGEKVFKFDSVPAGFRFTGAASTNKIKMSGEIEGDQKNIVLKTDIPADQIKNYKVTGTMDKVTKVDKNGIKTDDILVDAFTLKMGTRANLDVKAGTSDLLSKTQGSTIDTTSSPFYDYIHSDMINESSLTLVENSKLIGGDILKGELKYTLAGTVDFT